MRLMSRVGRRIVPSGPPPAPANRSARPVNGKGQPTNGISGQPSTALSASVALQSSLANRLLVNLDENGSLEYRLTWKHWDMPSGLQICALRASVHRTSDSDFSGWPTPKLPSGGGCLTEKNIAHTHKLEDAALLTGWASPTSRDHKDGTSEGTVPVNGLLGRQVWGWNTPIQNDGEKRGVPRVGAGLAGQVHGNQQQPLNATTEKRGALAPEFVCWLMGFPPEHLNCAPTAMPSSRKRQQRS